MMENEIRQTAPKKEIVPEDIASLLEEIRMTSLNLAVASAKFKAYNPKQDQIKKDLVEVVALALESVQFLSRFLDTIGIKADADPILINEIDHNKVGDNLHKLSKYIERITDNFMKDQGKH